MAREVRRGVGGVEKVVMMSLRGLESGERGESGGGGEGSVVVPYIIKKIVTREGKVLGKLVGARCVAPAHSKLPPAPMQQKNEVHQLGCKM